MIGLLDRRHHFGETRRGVDDVLGRDSVCQRNRNFPNCDCCIKCFLPTLLLFVVFLDQIVGYCVATESDWWQYVWISGMN
jgi:hypothetical protein